MDVDKSFSHVNQVVDRMDVDQECAAVEAKQMCNCVFVVAWHRTDRDMRPARSLVKLFETSLSR